ncbi:MAG: FAD-dependent oxidoreductase [Candidatus Bathyarchaeia archaeon]
MLKKLDIIIIGAGVAGVTAAVSARKQKPQAKIAILSHEVYPAYSKPSLPYVISRSVAFNEIVIYPPEDLKARNIQLLSGFEVYSINPKERILRARAVNGVKEIVFAYNTLILATGGNEVVPLIKGAELGNVFTMRTFEDALKISKSVKPGKPAVVVGAGPIGLSTAQALNARGMKTIMVIRSRILRALLEPDLSLILQERAKIAGIKTIIGAEVEEIGGFRIVEYVKVPNKKISASMVIFALGVRPSVKLAKEAHIDLGRYGGIKVDEHMRTSNDEIFAAGDCIEITDLITGKPTYVPVGSIAAETGRIAGVNAAGGNEKSEGFIRIQGDNFFGLDVTSIGHSSATASTLGIKASVSDVHPQSIFKDVKHFFKKYPVKVKIITDEKRRVIGAQTLGSKFMTMNRYALLQAIKEKMKIDEFLDSWKEP